ncbi:allene oxide cyclase barrel-like domain-containing protein [Streptomyces sp. NBC_00019]|uniref:allene oxide cyclase barrel-like domain-containing protein n=1 Tax=Streptomyces sp. NBC_00019 TaxID=2975623 RepID=UPI00324D4681
MRSTSFPARLTVAGAAAAALVVPIGTAAGAAEAAPAHGKSRHCVTVSFIEQLVTTDTTDVAPAGPSVGDVVITEDAVLDEDRNRVGTNDIQGVIIKKDAATGELFSFSTAKYTLDDGVIQVAGIVNLTRLAAGETQKLPAAGLKGRYAGKTGELTWTLVSATESLNSIKLCG